MVEAMGVSLKIEQRRSHSAVSSFGPWMMRAEGYRGTRHLEPCRQVPVKPRRPPSLRLICEVFPDHSSFSVLREILMAFCCDYFKKLNCYPPSLHLIPGIRHNPTWKWPLKFPRLISV